LFFFKCEEVPFLIITGQRMVTIKDSECSIQVVSDANSALDVVMPLFLLRDLQNQASIPYAKTKSHYAGVNTFPCTCHMDLYP